jgi:hypothetical protein
MWFATIVPQKRLMVKVMTLIENMVFFIKTFNEKKTPI